MSKGNYFETVQKSKQHPTINTNINNNDKDNAEINPPVKFNTEDPLDKLNEEMPLKELTTVLKGIYFDSEVSNVIDEQAKKLGRGGKSKIVNEIVKKYFIDKGLL